jgi:hypothetical protein
MLISLIGYELITGHYNIFIHQKEVGMGFLKELSWRFSSEDSIDNTMLYALPRPMSGAEILGKSRLRNNELDISLLYPYDHGLSIEEKNMWYVIDLSESPGGSQGRTVPFHWVTFCMDDPMYVPSEQPERWGHLKNIIFNEVKIFFYKNGRRYPADGGFPDHLAKKIFS